MYYSSWPVGLLLKKKKKKKSLKAVHVSLAPICGISGRLSCSMSAICVLRAAQSVKSARESYISAGT